MNYWNHVLWSDESKVNLFDADSVQQVRRRPGEEHQENCAFPTVKHGGGSIMVWDCMTTAGTGELRFIEGNMDSNMYCDILKQKMMPSLQKLFPNITTPNTPSRWQLPCCWRWRSGQVRLQTWTLLCVCVYIIHTHYLTKMSTPLTFQKKKLYSFWRDKAAQMKLGYILRVVNVQLV